MVEVSAARNRGISIDSLRSKQESLCKMWKVLNYLQSVLYSMVKWYYRKSRWITKRGLRFRLAPGVFHPSLYHSTDILLDYALGLNLEKKRILELGCGSGFISMFLAKHHAVEMYASDINQAAVESLRENSIRNQTEVEVRYSDLFTDLSELKFDIILVNPPYYFKDPGSLDEYAFYLGRNGEYFKRFFAELGRFYSDDVTVILVLSANVKFELIEEMAQEENYLLVEDSRSRRWQEDFIIYRVQGQADQTRSFA